MKKKSIIPILFLFLALLLLFEPVKQNSIQRIELRIGESQAWPGLVRIAPIVINDDGDWGPLASSGDGTPANPWVIQNKLIECNWSGSGISVTGTTNHAILRNIYINETGPSLPAYDCGILLMTVSNVDVDNVTIEHSKFAGLICGISTDVIVNHTTLINATQTSLLVANSSRVIVSKNHFSRNNYLDFELANAFNPNFDITLYDNDFFSNTTWGNVRVYKTTNLNMTNNVFLNNVTIADGQANIRTSNGTIANNTFGMIGNTSDTGLYVSGGFTIENNKVYDFFDTSMLLGDGASPCIVRDNTIVNSSSTNYASGMTISDVGSTFENNTFINCTRAIMFAGGASDEIITNNTFINNTIDVYVDDTSSNNTLKWNNFTGNSLLYIETGSPPTGEMNFTSNYIDVPSINNTQMLVPGFTWTFDLNFYKDYFTRFPYDVTKNTTTLVLESEYTIVTTLNDTRPCYYEDWFPRSQLVNIHAFSNVDGQGITFENLKMYIDSVQIASPSSTIMFVLFRLTIEDFKGNLLHDQMYTLNSTTANLNVGLDVAVQIWIFYSSSIDDLGFSFDLAKLYIDGVRTPISNPIMDHEIIEFCVKDFANRVLYNQTWNLTLTGIFVDIPLPVVTVVIHNKFEFGVIFHYMIANVERSFPIDGGQYVDDFRIATGNYDWWLTDAEGNPIDDQDGEEYSRSKTIRGPDFIDFGFTSASPENIYVTSILDYVIFILLFVGLMAMLAFVAKKVGNNQKSKGPSHQSNSPSLLAIFKPGFGSNSNIRPSSKRTKK